MAWIKFEKDLLTDPRVLRIARTLERRWVLFDGAESAGGGQYDPCNATALPAVTLVCGALIRMWSLADTHLGEDDVLPLGAHEIDDLVGVPGFCDLLPGDWLTVIDGGAVKLPDFHTHNGTEAKKKAQTAKRVSVHRKRNATPLRAPNALALPDQTRPDQTIKQPLGGKPPDPVFEECWKRFPKRNGNNPKADALKAWNARIKEKVNVGAMRAGLERYAAWCDATGKTGTEVVMQAVRFFGKARPFEQDWELPKKANGKAGPPWWASDATIIAKGKEVGIDPRPGESIHEFKGRINVELGM